MYSRTAIIDIGSNSARLVIFEKTSKYGFHLVCEQKSKVRIGEDAYEKNGYLQPIGIKRAYSALLSFLNTIQKYQVNSTICVATSALRDAPNAQTFISWIKNELGIEIQIISGNKEATYGAIAALNLLPIQTAITIDIGGGSSDIALIKNGTIIDTYSLNLGTVRLKELFFDKAENIETINEKSKLYISKQLTQIPKHFIANLAVGIGGTARTLSKAVMKRSSYPLDKLHAFTYEVNTVESYFNGIPKSSAKNLINFGLKKNRFDTIREGTLIFSALLSYLDIKQVITSAAGVREGVFLEGFLNQDNHKFPDNVNPSIHSLLDRFKPQVKTEKKCAYKLEMGSELYSTLQCAIEDEYKYKQELLWALELSNIGKMLTIYKSHHHAFYIAMQELNFGITQTQSLLVASLLRFHGKELVQKSHYLEYQTLLPNKNILKWLSFIYSLTVYIHESLNEGIVTFKYANRTLTITANTSLYLAREKIKSLQKPLPFAIIIEDKNILPKNITLGIL